MSDRSLADGPAVLRQKFAAKSAATPPPVDDGAGAALKSWGLALGRAARDEAGLPLEVTKLTFGQHALAEVMDMPPERAMLMVLDEPGAVGLGLLALSGALVSALVEKLTTGRVLAQAPSPRRATRTDALLLSSLIDRAMDVFDAARAPGPVGWAAGYRYASTLEDARPMALMFDDVRYAVLQAEVSVERGLRSGQVILALPMLRAGAADEDTGGQVETTPGPPDPALFRAALSAQVAGAQLPLDAVLARLHLPISRLMALQPGEVLALPHAALDRLRIEARGAGPVAQARLGQTRGLRAARLTAPPHEQARASAPDQTTAAAFDRDAGLATAAE